MYHSYFIQAAMSTTCVSMVTLDLGLQFVQSFRGEEMLQKNESACGREVCRIVLFLMIHKDVAGGRRRMKAAEQQLEKM